jgi:predicted metal-dependent enzyme (double-stranded beta helix superfamily)
MSHGNGSALPTSLVEELARATEGRSTEDICAGVAMALEKKLSNAPDFLDPRFLKPVPAGYARRLLHRDPEGRFTALAMVWGRDQETPLHDHSGLWCVECVYRGQIRVDSYEMTDRSDDGRCRFVPETREFAGSGKAGLLIPPREHHIVANADRRPSVTIHVYGGEMTECSTFERIEGDLYRQVVKPLVYTP